MDNCKDFEFEQQEILLIKMAEFFSLFKSTTEKTYEDSVSWKDTYCLTVVNECLDTVIHRTREIWMDTYKHINNPIVKSIYDRVSRIKAIVDMALREKEGVVNKKDFMLIRLEAIKGKMEIDTYLHLLHSGNTLTFG